MKEASRVNYLSQVTGNAMVGLVWVLAALTALAGTSRAETKGVDMGDKMIGMYVHQHWGYNHPYAARTWTVDDWHGYLDGLKKMGFNTVLIWPVLETMPNPLTPSDEANLEKIAKVIDMAHHEFGMKAFITISPNAGAKDEEAAKYTFQERPFFYCDMRVDTGDAGALGRLIEWREKLFTPLKNMDGVFIIDSDPGGWPGATNIDFVYLLQAHRRMFDRLRPGIDLYYWIHAGWESYCRYYLTGEFEMGQQPEIEDAIALLARVNPEPWGLASGRGPGVADKLGMPDRVMTFSYGAIEGEPTFPMTNYGGEHAYRAGKNSGVRGTMGNSQTHCIQLPNAFAFVRGAQGLPVEEADYIDFANQLLPGHGETVFAGWKALGGRDANAMRAAIEGLEKLQGAPLETGPLKGLLFGDPQRFISDIVMQLRLRSTLEDFHAAVMNNAGKEVTGEAFRRFVDAADAWQKQHAYKNMWRWPELEEALEKINDPGVNAALDKRKYKSEDTSKTPFEQVQEGYYRVETYTPSLIAAMRKAADAMR